MTTRRRPLRRPGLLLVAETLLVVMTLTVTSGLAAGIEPTPAPDASATASVEPSATAGTAPPDATEAPTEPAPTPDPTDAPSPAPEPTVAPDPAPDPEPSPGVAPSPTPDPEPSSDPSASPTVGELHVDHAWVDTIDRRSGRLRPGGLDAPATGVAPGQIYVARFRIVNGSGAPVAFRPALEFGFGLEPTGWTAVPTLDPVKGVPLYSSSNVLRGEEPGTTTIAVEDLRLASGPDPAGQPVSGIANAGVNPAPRITLAAGEYTEISFTVRATSSAAWLARYSLRLGGLDGAIGGTAYAVLQLSGRPPVILSPGQRSGVRVPDATSAGGSSKPSGGIVAWALEVTAFTSPHGDYTLTSDKCAACHATHTASGPLLSGQPTPQSNLCLTCHDGTGATADIAAQYDDPAVPANDPDSDSWYRHPATVASTHTSDRDEAEFKGVENRHAACSDCHQPHRADASLAAQTPLGWTASGALLGASGVAVTNGSAGSEPTYTWQPESTYEYQLCFKCHSGFTELPANTGGPSTWALDKAVELNPANLSYHPVEAPGTNATIQMTRSLEGTSPYKLWTFTTASTVRCVNCHGDPRVADPASPPDPGARLAPHAVANRSMLLAGYRDRILKGPSDAYAAADFALCYACHAEAPFVDTSQSPRLDSNFPIHGTHTAAIASSMGPTGESIDIAGAGGGNALCAECHFRTHGTALAVGGQDPERRLVNFAPNVEPYGGPNADLQGVLDYDDAGNSCTLRCHGVDHGGWSY